MNTINISIRLLATALLLVVTGCGDSGPEVIDFEGQVIHQGKPVPNLLVNFIPQKGRPSWGMTDAEGKFRLSFRRDQAGALIGRHKVFVQFTPKDPAEELALLSGEKKLSDEQQAILDKYGSADTSPLTVMVAEDMEEPVKIELD